MVSGYPSTDDVGFNGGAISDFMLQINMGNDAGGFTESAWGTALWEPTGLGAAEWQDFPYRWFDVAAWMVSLRCVRGRSVFDETFRAGRMVVRLQNFEGEWATPGGVTFAEDLRPGMHIRWAPVNQVTPDVQWLGVIRDIREVYDLYGNAYVDLTCDDALAQLAAVTLPDVPTYLWDDLDEPEDAFGRVLDAAQWPSGSTFREYHAPYAHNFEPYDIGGRNALDVLRLLAFAEGGAVYASKAGAVVFQDLSWLTDTIGAAIDYEIESDGTGDVDLRSLGPVVRTNERVVNAVTFKRPSQSTGAGVSSVDPGSIDAFGRRELVRSDVIVDEDTKLETLADRIVNYRAFPQREVQQVQIRPATATERADICALDFGDVIRVRYEHPHQSWAWTIDTNLVGIGHDFQRDGTWTVTLQLDATWQET